MSKKLQRSKVLRGALTGGIGAGKSIIAKLFEVLGVPVFYSDTEASILINSSKEIKKAILDLFGTDAYTPKGKLDKDYVAKRVFSDSGLRTRLNEIVHPAVRRRFDQWVLQQSAPYVLNEAAIAFETGMHQLMDFTILVVAPKKLRIERVVTRDSVTAPDVVARIDAQWSDEKKEKLADFIVKNDGEDALIPQVLEIDKTIRSPR